MARRRQKVGGNEFPGGIDAEAPAGVSSARRVEDTMTEFAEDLGRLLGTAKAKAEGWIGQRHSIAEQLSEIRDTASELLSKLTGAATAAAARTRRRRVGRRNNVNSDGPPRRTRKLSAKARAAISRAQKARWRRQKAAQKAAE